MLPLGSAVSVLGSLETETNIVVPSLVYILDGQTHNNATALSNSTLYSSPSLTLGHHSLELILKQNGTSITVSGMNISSDPPPPHRPPASTLPVIIGCAVGGVFLMLVILGVVLFRRQRRTVRCKSSFGDRLDLDLTFAASFGTGELQPNMPMSKKAFTSRTYSNYGISFVYSGSAPPSTDSFTASPKKSVPRRMHQLELTKTDVRADWD